MSALEEARETVRFWGERKRDLALNLLALAGVVALLLWNI